MSEAIGADIESICRKCGDVWHVVVAKKEDSIAKVQCKQCAGVHRLNRPEGKMTKTTKKTAKKSTKKKTTRKAKTPAEPPVAADPDRPARSYHPKEHFQPGDTLDHPSFGQGVVQAVQGTKMTVFFPEGERRLVQGR